MTDDGIDVLRVPFSPYEALSKGNTYASHNAVSEIATKPEDVSSSKLKYTVFSDCIIVIVVAVVRLG